MRIRKFLRQRKTAPKGCPVRWADSGALRGQAVYEALLSGHCVDCGASLIIKEHSFKCPVCGWSGEFSCPPGLPL